MPYVIGVDLSHHNVDGGKGWPKWDQVKAAGVRFAFFKATEGTSYVDPTFYGLLDGAHTAGLYVGAYHFGRPDADPITQVRHLYRTLNGRHLHFAPVLDLEVEDGQSSLAIQMWAARFVTECERVFGTKPILYTGAYFLNGTLAKKDFGCRRWIARYNSLPPAIAWDIWQHSSDATIAGITGRVDENFTTEERLASLLGATPAPQPEEDDVPPLAIEDEGTPGVLWYPGDGAAVGLHNLDELNDLIEAKLVSRSGLDKDGKVITHKKISHDLFNRLFPEVVP